VNVDRLKQRFTAFRGDAYASFDTLRERILAEFARQAENSVKTAGSDIVLYLTLTVPLEGIEELMYQIIMDDFKKSMDISESSRHQGPVAEGRPVERPVEIPVVQPIHVPAEQPVQVPVEQQVEQNGKPPAMVAAPEVSPAEPQEEGLKLLYEKRYEEAVEYYKKKAKESPRDPEGWFGLSACLFLTGEIKKCTLYYNRCVENKPGFDISDRLLKLAGDDFENLYNLAERLQVIELFAEAQRYIEYLEAQSLPEDLLKKLQALPKKTGNSKSEVEA
jgi:tetratricopeptide (TPR) repeat protein